MKTCPNCGGENLQTASSCRLCATPLEAIETMLGVRADISLGDQIPATVDISGPEPVGQHAPASTYGGHVICEFCKAVNEQDYAYCQQCGKPIPSAGQAARPVKETRPAGKGADSLERQTSITSNEVS